MKFFFIPNLVILDREHVSGGMFTPKRMYSCCVCVSLFKFTDLQALECNRMDPKLVRHLSSTLCEHRLCRNCKRKCPQCNACIPHIQLKTHDKCAVCAAAAGENLKKRRKI